MGRTSKVSKKVKIKACKDYSAGKGNYETIAKSIGIGTTTFKRWYQAYRIHGESKFKNSSKNQSYSSSYKESIIDEYRFCQCSVNYLAAKHNISDSVIRKWIKKYYNGIEFKDYDPKGDVYTMKSRKTTFEERLGITKWVISHDMNYKDAADRYAIKYALIYQWVQKYLADGDDALKHKKRGPKPKQEIDESSLDEVERLKLELEREKALRERAEFKLEILKKKEEFEQRLRSRK